MRCTGSSGQIELHQPLLPLRNMPPVKPLTSANSNSAPLQGPFVCSPTLRSVMKRTNSVIEMR